MLKVEKVRPETTYNLIGLSHFQYGVVMRLISHFEGSSTSDMLDLYKTMSGAITPWPANAFPAFGLPLLRGRLTSGSRGLVSHLYLREEEGV